MQARSKLTRRYNFNIDQVRLGWAPRSGHMRLLKEGSYMRSIGVTSDDYKYPYVITIPSVSTGMGGSAENFGMARYSV